MDAFIQKFCEKYSLPIALSLQLLDNMEKFTFHKGDFLVQEGGRNSNFYIVSKGIWRGHYLNDGVDVSVWFASEGEAIFRHGDMWKIQFRWFPSKRCVTVNFMVFRRQNSKYYMPDLLNWLILEDDCSSSSF